MRRDADEVTQARLLVPCTRVSGMLPLRVGLPLSKVLAPVAPGSLL